MDIRMVIMDDKLLVNKLEGTMNFTYGTIIDTKKERP